MRQISTEFQAHLDTGATTLATCWRITRKDGAVLGFTDHDLPLDFDGVVHAPETGADGAALVSTADLGIDNSEIEGALTSDRLSADDLAAGRYDDAEVEIWRVNWADVSERVLLKRAVIGDVVREGGRFRAELRGASHKLGRTTGRLYQRLCDAVVGDARCGVDLDKAQFNGAGVVTSIPDSQRIIASGIQSFDGGWFAHGVLTWVTGANAGDRAHIKAHDAGASGASLSLWLPPASTIVPGDTFTVTAGCDRRHGTCAEKFANLVNFRGFHLMPGNDFAVSYPLRRENNDGGKR